MTGPAPDPARGGYGIAVAAELVGMDPQSLRLYERRGLLEPARTDGGTRRYSSDDVDRLRRITELLAAGLNLAGIARVLRPRPRSRQRPATHPPRQAEEEPLTLSPGEEQPCPNRWPPSPIGSTPTTNPA